MKLIVDTHTHFYPCYDLVHALGRLAYNLEALGGRECTRVGMLTERRECDVFLRIAEGAVSIAPWSVQRLAENILRLRHEEAGELWLVAGRQVATVERVEVLGLGLVEKPADGQRCVDTLLQVEAAGGLAVLCWAPGKWWGTRGALVQGLVETMQPDFVALGDTTLRPRGYPQPKIFRVGRRRGLRLLAGSDALPFEGEAAWLGRYASLIEIDQPWPGAHDDPWPALRSLLLNGLHRTQVVGQRGGWFGTLRRLTRNSRSSRR